VDRGFAEAFLSLWDQKASAKRVACSADGEERDHGEREDGQLEGDPGGAPEAVARARRREASPEQGDDQWREDRVATASAPDSLSAPQIAN
jgi:hypothetical protein